MPEETQQSSSPAPQPRTYATDRALLRTDERLQSAMEEMLDIGDLLSPRITIARFENTDRALLDERLTAAERCDWTGTHGPEANRAMRRVCLILRGALDLLPEVADPAVLAAAIEAAQKLAAALPGERGRKMSSLLARIEELATA